MSQRRTNALSERAAGTAGAELSPHSAGAERRGAAGARYRAAPQRRLLELGGEWSRGIADRPRSPARPPPQRGGLPRRGGTAGGPGRAVSWQLHPAPTPPPAPPTAARTAP